MTAPAADPGAASGWFARVRAYSSLVRVRSGAIDVVFYGLNDGQALSGFVAGHLSSLGHVGFIDWEGADGAPPRTSLEMIGRQILNKPVEISADRVGAMLSLGILPFHTLIAPHRLAELFRTFSIGLAGTQALTSVCEFGPEGATARALSDLSRESSRPSVVATLMAAVEALHLAHQSDAAKVLRGAVLRILEDNIHTEAFTLLAPYTRRLSDPGFCHRHGVPSVVIMRTDEDLPKEIGDLVLRTLREATEALIAGALVIAREGSTRLRVLSLRSLS